MTAPDLLRQLADAVEENESLKQRISELETELKAAQSQVPTVQKEWFKTDEAASRIGRSPAFLNKDRMLPQPVIPFRKDSARVVRYHRSDLDAYNEERRAKKRSK